MSLPALDDVYHLFTNEEVCIRFLREHSVFYTSRNCEICQGLMTYYENSRRFRCNKTTCRSELSFKANSFFSGHKLLCSKILRLGYFWLNQCPTKAIVSMTGCSKDTIANFSHYFRQLITCSFNPEDNQIGGDNIIVEIDESKFGKRKYNRGHRVEGSWVFGGIERTPEKRFFVVTVPDRSADTLIGVLRRHILPGTIIFSDMWRSYNSIRETLGFEHLTVNHSINFRDPISGVHTNTIEGLWNGIKIGIAPRNRGKKQIDGHLMEFIWRRQNKGDLWLAFIAAMADIHYD